MGKRVLRFNAFTLDQPRRALLRDGTELELRSQSFDVLSYLVEHAGQLVSKQELFEAVWGGAARTDDSLVQCIKDIRQALGDSDHQTIKTVHRRGYVLVAEVSERAAPALEAKPQTYTSALGNPPDHVATAPQAAWQAPLIAACLLFIALVGSGWLLWKQAHPGPAPVLTMMGTPSIAVLPVKPLGDETDTALATLADEIARGIWRAPRGFNPDMRPQNIIKDARGDAKTMGRQLGVRYLVQTSARREGDLMQVNVQLIEAENNRQVWVGPFEYRLGQPGAQSRMAAGIGRTLAVELLRIEVRRPLPANPGAAHFTMVGRSLMADEANAKSTREALTLFEKAIAADPNYFLGLAHYARTVANSSLSGWLPDSEQEEKITKAEDAIQKALKREPASAGAHVVHGNVLRAKGEHEQAIEAFRLALVHVPNFTIAHAELGRALIDVGKADEAIAEIKKAIALSPTDISLYIWCYWAGLAAVHLGDHEGALDWLRKSYQANRGYDNTLRLMAVALADAGHEDDARQKIKEFLKLRPDATLDDWKRPNSRQHPVAAERREHIRATLARLGVPATKQAAAPLTMMAVPSIAVMPFKSAGIDGGNGESALAGEVATQLQRVPRGFRIAIRPAPANLDEGADIKTIGRDLDARYVVLGSLRREGKAVQVNVRLIEAETNRQLWAGPFDYPYGEIGAQSRIAAQIARLVTERLVATESKRPLPAEPQADHYAIMGRAMWAGERDAKLTLEAMALFKQGLDLDPNSVPALQGYARTKISAVLSGWGPKGQRSQWLDEAEVAIDRVIAQQRRSYGAYRLRGSLFRARGNWQQAVKALERALDINSDYAEAHAELGRVKIELGLANEAITHINKALALSPTDSGGLAGWYLWAGEAAVHLGDHEAAADWLERARQANHADKSAALWLAIAYAGLDQMDKARAEMAEYLRSTPDFTLALWNENNRRDNPTVAAQRARIEAALRRLGAPEGHVRTGSVR